VLFKSVKVKSISPSDKSKKEKKVISVPGTQKKKVLTWKSKSKIPSMGSKKYKSK
jgi:hypothetical protein